MNDNNYIPKHASFKDMKKFYVKDNKKKKNRMLYMIISLIFIQDIKFYYGIWTIKRQINQLIE